MLTKPIVVVGLVAGVIVAAAAGAYLAVRQNAAALPQLVEADAGSAANGLTSSELSGPGTTIEATDVVVNTVETAVSEEVRTLSPSPVRATPREQPVSAPPPTQRSSPAPAERTSPPAPEPTPAVSDQTTATVVEAVAEVTPANPTPVQTARADLTVVEGWTRPEATEPSHETLPEPIEPALPIRDTGSIDHLASEPPVPSFVELELAADSVIGLQVDTAVSTATAEVEDTVQARVTRDVLVGDRVAVPAGTRMLGSVVLVEKGGKLRDGARLGVRFHTLVMDDGLQVPIVTETIYREGRSRGSNSVAKIGGAAVGGAILGAIFGGSRGAAIGGSIGAAGGTAAALNGEAEPARLPPGTMLTVRLSRRVAITVDQ